MSRLLFTFAAGLALAAAQLTSSSLENHVDALTLSGSFNPVQEAYWTGYPHHRRTPFAVSPDGKSAFLAYLDSSGTGVHVQGVDPGTFAAVGEPVSVSGGKEAGGLVAHNDGFALLTNEVTSDSDKAIAVLYRYTNGKQTFKTLLGGSGIKDSMGNLASPDINGDLVYSEKAGYYAAYIVVTAYSGSANGHFGDAIRYITTDGKLETISGASSSWGCSHNTGIAFEEADQPPFASICAEDQGAIWLNTKGQGMSTVGVKISNEVTINGGSNEPMGGMGGSYSALARFIGSNAYIFSWVSRGATDLYLNDWMGSGYTKAKNRTNNRNVAIALFSDKNTLVGEQATSQVGAEDGDSQINWVTQGANDCSNAHVAAFSSSSALVSWEEISNPICPFEAMGCKGTFAGTSFQMVDSSGKKVGDVVKSQDTYVAGDMVTMSDGRICWPYVSMDWKLDGPTRGSSVTKMSFACMNAGGSGSGSGSGSTATSAAVGTTQIVSQVTSAGEAQSTAAGNVQTTLAAEETSVQTTNTLPDDAPRPSLVTLSTSVQNNLPPVTSDALPVETTAAAESTAAQSSAVAQSSIIDSDAPRPSLITLSSSVPNNLPDPTSAPVASSSAVPIQSDIISVPADSSASAVPTSAVVSTPVQTPIPCQTDGFQTRTRRRTGTRTPTTPTRRTTPTGRQTGRQTGSGSGSGTRTKKPCKPLHTKTATVFVTARA